MFKNKIPAPYVAGAGTTQKSASTKCRLGPVDALNIHQQCRLGTLPGIEEIFDFMVWRSRLAGLTEYERDQITDRAAICSSVGVAKQSGDECSSPVLQTQKCCTAVEININRMLHRYFFPASALALYCSP